MWTNTALAVLYIIFVGTNMNIAAAAIIATRARTPTAIRKDRQPLDSITILDIPCCFGLIQPPQPRSPKNSAGQTLQTHIG
jgi:hypothetical protein